MEEIEEDDVVVVGVVVVADSVDFSFSASVFSSVFGCSGVGTVPVAVDATGSELCNFCKDTNEKSTINHNCCKLHIHHRYNRMQILRKCHKIPITRPGFIGVCQYF